MGASGPRTVYGTVIGMNQARIRIAMLPSSVFTP